MHLDIMLLRFFNQTLAHPALDRAMAAITLAAMPGILACPLALWKAHRKQAAALLAAIILATLLSVAIQFAIQRPRPAGVRLTMPLSAFPSFPSGHAAAWFASATLAALFWQGKSWPAFLLAGLVSISRLYLGQHYPSDVLGGAIIGAATAAIVYGTLYSPASEGRPRWAWLLWGQLALVTLAILCAYLNLYSWALNSTTAFLTWPGADKALHFLLFGLLALLSVGWWARQSPGAILAGLGLLATIEESLQALSPTRSFDLIDLAATLAGIALFGWLGVRIVGRKAGRAGRGATLPSWGNRQNS